MDETEAYRRQRVVELNSAQTERAALEAQYGQVWTTDELAVDFEPLQFMAPYVVARRRSDGKMGSLEFQHSPRFYFNWKEDN